jgi:AcrR family transcriptional regulator
VARDDAAVAERPGERRGAAPPDVEALDEAQRHRRALVVDAARRLMTTTEYDRIQMKDLAAGAGVALGTVYRYFSSKDHLLAEALLAWSAGYPSEPAMSTLPSVDQLKLAYRLAVRAFEPHPMLYGTMVVLQSSGDPHARAVYERFAARQTEAFERYLPELPPARRADVVRVMSAVLDLNLREWALGRQPVEEVYRMIDVTADLLLGPG